MNVIPPNPPEFGNPGWDPYGLSDTTHPWWNIEGGPVTFNGSSNALTIVWGSPNDNNPDATNTVSFYTGANGTGSLIGQVLASDLYANFSDIDNTQDPGYLVSFMTPAEVRQRRVHDRLERLRVRRGPRTVDLGDAGHRLRRPRGLAGCKRARRDRLAPALG